MYGLDFSQGIGEAISRLWKPIIKIETVIKTAMSFGFLSVLVPHIWPLFFLHYAARFVSNEGLRWDLGLHYNAEIAPSFAVATVLGFSVLLTKFPKKYRRKVLYIVSGIVLCGSILLHRFYFRGPLGLTYNKAFYEHSQDFTFLEDVVKKIPKNASVTAQNNIIVRFTHQEAYILRPLFKQKKTDYVIFDLRPGQNPYHVAMSDEAMKETFQIVDNDSDYALIYNQGDQYIFKRKK